MFTFCIDPECGQCHQLLEEVAEHHLAHKVMTVDPEDPGQTPGAHVLVDDGEVIHGHSRISERIDERAQELKLWRRFPGDYCYDYGDENSC